MPTGCVENVVGCIFGAAIFNLLCRFGVVSQSLKVRTPATGASSPDPSRPLAFAVVSCLVLSNFVHILLLPDTNGDTPDLGSGRSRHLAFTDPAMQCLPSNLQLLCDLGCGKLHYDTNLYHLSDVRRRSDTAEQQNASHDRWSSALEILEVLAGKRKVPALSGAARLGRAAMMRVFVGNRRNHDLWNRIAELERKQRRAQVRNP